MAQPTCNILKSDDIVCGRRATRNLDDTHPAHVHLCGTHRRTYAAAVERSGHRVMGRCFRFDKARGDWCDGVILETTLCTRCVARHALLAERRNRRNGRAELLIAVADAIEANPLLPNLRERMTSLWSDPLNEDANNETIARLLYIREVGRNQQPRYTFHELAVVTRAEGRFQRDPHTIAELAARHADGTRWLEHMWQTRENRDRPAADPGRPPRAEHRPLGLRALRELAADRQNVHTTVVTERTNGSVAILLAEGEQLDAAACPKLIHRHLLSVWATVPYTTWSRLREVIDHIVEWCNKATCRTTGDYLYRSVLKALFVRIRDHPDANTRAELWKRLFQECTDSIGMCCEGQMSRLCNVLVGFDDAFKPAISIGELTQQKMSSIAGMDVAISEKVKLAISFFLENGITSADEQAPWLDALV